MSERKDTAIATGATLAALAIGLLMLWLAVADNQRAIIDATIETHAQVVRIEATVHAHRVATLTNHVAVLRAVGAPPEAIDAAERRLENAREEAARDLAALVLPPSPPPGRAAGGGE